MSDETKSTETAATDTATQENAANEGGASSAATMETQTVEEANAESTSTAVADQTASSEQSADGSAEESTSDSGGTATAEAETKQPLDAATQDADPAKAPAFHQQQETAPEPMPFALHESVNEEMILAKTKNALQQIIPNERRGAIYDMLISVSANPLLLNSCSVVQLRVLKHPNARLVNVENHRSRTLQILADVLIGEEQEYFTRNGLDENILCEYYQQVTPVVASLL